jgi:hypothetical protein
MEVTGQLHTHTHLYPRFPFDRRLSGHRSRTGRGSEEKKILSCQESNFVLPTRILDTDMHCLSLCRVPKCNHHSHSWTVKCRSDVLLLRHNVFLSSSTFVPLFCTCLHSLSPLVHPSLTFPLRRESCRCQQDYAISGQFPILKSHVLRRPVRLSVSHHMTSFENRPGPQKI